MTTATSPAYADAVGTSPDTSSESLARALESYRVLAGKWRQFRLDNRTYFSAYHQRHWSSIAPEGSWQVTLPIEALAIDTALAMITSSDPLLTVFPSGGDEASDRATADADRAERWHLGVDYTTKRQAGVDPRVEALLNSLLYGLGWIREVAAFPPDWGSADYQPDSDLLHYSFPILQQSIHPSQVMFRWGRAPGGITHLVYEALYTVDEIETEWGVRLASPSDSKGNLIPKNPMELRKLIEYWEWRHSNKRPSLYHCVFVTGVSGPEGVIGPGGQLTGQPALVGGTSIPYSPSDVPLVFPEWVKRPTEMPEYRRIPYYKVACYQTAEELPHERFLSFLFKLREIPHLTEIVVSRELQIADMYADPTIVAKSASGQPIAIEKGPGAVIDIGLEDSVDFLRQTGAIPDLPRIRDMLLQMGYLSSFSPAVLSGQSTGDSALARTMDVEQSLFKIAAPTRHYKEALEDLYWHRAQLLKAFSPSTPVATSGEDMLGRPFTVRQTGNQLARNSLVNVRVRPGFYSRLLADINVATQAFNAKMWSMDTGMDFMGVQDKEAERAKLKRDLIEFSPSVLAIEEQVFAQELMKELKEGQGEQGTAGAEGPLGAMGTFAGAGGAAPGTPGQESGPSGLQPAVQGVANSLAAIQGQTPSPVTGAPSSVPLTPLALRALQLRRAAGGPATGGP